MVRRCPKCKSLNEDQYMYCFKCNSPLPPKYKINALVEKGRKYLEDGDYRNTIKTLENAVKMDPGNKEAFTMLAVAYRKLKLFNDMRDAYEVAGIRYREITCTNCRGTGICPDCDGQKICLMCNGRGKCRMCQGTGICFVCGGNGKDCTACNGRGECPRCHGSGECQYCRGTGACGGCNGDGLCGICGGTRSELKIDVSTVIPTFRKYFRD